MNNSTPLSDFAQFFMKHRGIEFSHNGRPLPKFVVWDMMQRGKFISVNELTKKTKPGWHEGSIINPALMEDYLENLKF